MSWARLDDNLYDHPKLDGLPLAAVGLYAKSLSWSARHETDGYIPRGKVSALAKPERYPFKLAAILVKAGLWDEVGRDGYIARVRSARHPDGELHRIEGDGFQIHDYLDLNPSAATIQRERSGSRDRMKRYRDRMRGSTPTGLRYGVTGSDDAGLPDGSPHAPHTLASRSRVSDDSAEPHSRIGQVVDSSRNGTASNGVTSAVTDDAVTGPPDPTRPSSLSSEREKGTLHRSNARLRGGTSGEVAKFFDAYTALYTEKLGVPPLISGNGTASIIERVLHQYGADLTAQMLRRFFEADDPFYPQSGYTLKAFVACVPQLLAQVNGVAKAAEVRRQEVADVAYERRKRHVLGLED
jgi:hypothetical protein